MPSRNTEFDKCGIFQLYHVIFTQLPRCATAWILSLMMFGNYNPGWKCVQYGLQTNASASSSVGTKFQSTNLINKTNLHSARHTFSSEFYTNLVPNNSFEVNDSNCDLFVSCEIVEFNPLTRTIVSEFGLICDQSYIPSFIISIQMMGMFIGAIIGGQLGELLGRKIILYGSTALCSVLTFLAIFSSSWQVYSIFIFFIGAGSACILVLSGVYSMEFLQPKWRARMMGFPYYSLSFVLFTLTMYLLKHWFYIHIVTALFCAGACIGYCWSPESLRWLLVHGKINQSKRVIEKINKVNNKSMEMKDVVDYLSTLDKEVDVKRKYTNLDLFRSPETRWITVKIALLWFFLMMGYFALAFGVKSLVGDFYINVFIAGIVEIPAVVTVPPVMNILGRRMGVVLYIVIAGLGYLIAVSVYYLGSSEVSQSVFRYSAFVSRSATVAWLLGMILLTAELYPTAIRNVGMAFANTMGRLGAILAPYLLPLDQHSLILCYLVLGISSVFNVIVVLSLPETKDKSLSDSLGHEETTENIVDKREDSI